MTKWRIIFYPHLCPLEPRVYGETQLTNKRIYIFTKHKRHSKIGATLTLYHEVTHIILQGIFRKETLFDNVMDRLDYRFSRAIHLKAIVKEKGWAYLKKASWSEAYTKADNKLQELLKERQP